MHSDKLLVCNLYISHIKAADVKVLLKQFFEYSKSVSDAFLDSHIILEVSSKYFLYLLVIFAYRVCAIGKEISSDIRCVEIWLSFVYSAKQECNSIWSCATILGKHLLSVSNHADYRDWLNRRTICDSILLCQ